MLASYLIVGFVDNEVKIQELRSEYNLLLDRFDRLSLKRNLEIERII